MQEKLGAKISDEIPQKVTKLYNYIAWEFAKISFIDYLVPEML